MLGTAVIDTARKPMMMKRPATIDTRPTGSAPRRFTPVAIQITSSMIAYFAGPVSPGKKYPRYWRNSTG